MIAAVPQGPPQATGGGGAESRPGSEAPEQDLEMVEPAGVLVAHPAQGLDVSRREPWDPESRRRWRTEIGGVARPGLRFRVLPSSETDPGSQACDLGRKQAGDQAGNYAHKRDRRAVGRKKGHALQPAID